MKEISRIYLLCTLTIGGCVTSEPEGENGDPATNTTAQALELRTHYDAWGYGGSFFATSFNEVSERNDPRGDCSPGTTHPPGDPPNPALVEVRWYSNQGGFCMFDGWVGTAQDCRAKVRGSTSGGGFGGTCQIFVHEQPPNSFPYSVTNTNSAQVGTTDISIALAAGQTLTIGTCGVAGSSFSGDTYIRMFNSVGKQVKESDDACNGLGSNIVFTAPEKATFTIRAGCYSSTACSGLVVWTL